MMINSIASKLNMADLLFQWYMEVMIIGVVSGTIVLIRRGKKHDGPPTPPSIPIIGHLHLLIDPLPHRALHNLSTTHYGPIFRIFLGSIPCVVASTPETAKHFLKTHDSSFSDRFPSATTHYLTYGSKGFIFLPYGPYWKFLKKVLMSQLLGATTLHLLRSVRRSETMRFLRLLATKAETEAVVDVGDELMTLSCNITSRMIMRRWSCWKEEEAQEIKNMVMESMEFQREFSLSEMLFGISSTFFGINSKVKQCRARFDHFMDPLIHQHQQERKKRKQLMGEEDGQPQPTDLLHILLDILQQEESSQIKLTTDNIKAFIFDLLIGGGDTPAITIEWALSELINHPDVMEKAREEIESIVGKNRIIEELDTVNLPYLEAIVKETLRLHPPFALMTRSSNESCNIRGYEIPAKTVLLVNLWSIGRDPNCWEKPLEFRPERFMSDDGKKGNLEVRGQHFELMPFGSGRRACPGFSLALQIVLTNLGAMIQCFDWKLDGGKQSVEMEEKAGMTVSRANPLLCFPVPRLHPFPPLQD